MLWDFPRMLSLIDFILKYQNILYLFSNSSSLGIGSLRPPVLEGPLGLVNVPADISGRRFGPDA